MNTLWIIDPSVAGYDALLAQRPQDVEVLLLRRDQDGAAQIARFLSGRQAYDSISIFSHGASGLLRLGSSCLTDGNLDGYANDLALWRGGLSDQGDLLLYGCNVAEGTAGQRFVSRLAALTGADVAASDNPTGAIALGADMVLEVSTGVIEANTAVPDYAGLLAYQDDVFPGHTQGEYLNRHAFAAIKSDGSVVTWGTPEFGGYSGSMASALDGTVDVVQVFSTEVAFAALRADGSVISWGYPTYGGESSGVAGALDGTVDVTQIFSTRWAFAALRSDGSVVTWGAADYGGDSTAVADQLNGQVPVVRVFSCAKAFAALRADGSLVVWGDGNYGGDPLAWTGSRINDGCLDGTVKVVQVCAADGAFAAVREDGSVVTWGDPDSQAGDSSAVAGDLHDVVQVFSAAGAFAALRSDRTVVTWGDSGYGGDSTSVISQLQGVVKVFSSLGAFAALRSDGSLVTWGHSDFGGDSSAVAEQLNGMTDVLQVFATQRAFAALRADGSLVTWGDSGYGGNSASIASQLTDIQQVVAGERAFAALRADGSVVTWGDSDYGGDSSQAASQLNQVQRLFSNGLAFAALCGDGSVVSWGGSEHGGDSSAVARDLSSNVISVDDIYDDTNLTFPHTDGPGGDVPDQGNRAPTGWVSIVGQALQGQMLTATHNLSDADGLGVIQYQWQADGQPILYATGDRYILTQADVGKSISVLARYVDGLGTAESMSSSATDRVQALVTDVTAPAHLTGKRLLNGTGGADTLKGNNKADLMLGDAGSDRMDGRGGNDALYGSEDADKLFGGSGQDCLYGGSGDDVLSGQAGRDILVGGSGSDLMDGGAGADLYQYLARMLGTDDIGEGAADVLKVSRGDKIVFDAALWDDLRSGVSLDGLDGLSLGTVMDVTHNIIQHNNAIQIDCNGDGRFDASRDFSITLVGSAAKFEIDADSHGFLIR